MHGALGSSCWILGRLKLPLALICNYTLPEQPPVGRDLQGSLNPTAAQKQHAENPHQSCLTSTVSVLSLTPKVPKPGTWLRTGAATRICPS